MPDRLHYDHQTHPMRESSAEGPWVKLFVKLLENPIWTQLSPAVLKLAIYCILRANYRPSQWYDGSQQVDVPTGSFVTSYSKLSEACALTVKQIRCALVHLENLEFVAVSRAHAGAQHWTLVSVCNYEAYQGKRKNQGTDRGISEGTNWAQQGHIEGTKTAIDQNLQNPRTAESVPPHPADDADDAPDLSDFAMEIRNQFPPNRKGSLPMVQQAVAGEFGPFANGQLQSAMDRARRNLAAYLASAEVKNGICYGVVRWLREGHWQDDVTPPLDSDPFSQLGGV